MTDSPPKITDAPGLTWAKRKGGWEGRWRARKDLVRRGFSPRSVPLYIGWKLESANILYLQDQCRRLQDQMLIWGRGGLPAIAANFEGTWASLVDCYRSDPDSTYQTVRHCTRVNYDQVCEKLKKLRGEQRLADTGGRTFLAWHREAKGEGNHVAAAGGLMRMIRAIVGFGATILEERECRRLRDILHGLRFETTKARTEQITTAQADAVRSWAHRMLFHSVALAQAFAYECTFRQKDVIGEYVPMSDRELSTIHVGNDKWLRGLRWEEIDQNFILRHVTSKKQKPIECDLRLAPMVMEELAFTAGIDPAKALARADLPDEGPVVIYELTGVPFTGDQFRRQWRKVAKTAGVPKQVWNMDSRAGAITEATDSGADLEHVKHAAAHSDIGMTQKYSRGATKKIAGVMKLRVASRNKSGTSTAETQREQDDALARVDDALAQAKSVS